MKCYLLDLELKLNIQYACINSSLYNSLFDITFLSMYICARKVTDT